MNRYILGLVVLLSFGISYLSTSKASSVAVDISYTYRNDPASRALGLVPMRLHRDVDDQLYTRTLNVHFYGKPRTAEEILDVVIDNFDLDQFIELRLWIDEKAVSVDHTFTFAELSSLGSLSIDYRIEDNTPDSIKNRRITWLVGQLAGNCEETSES